MLRVKLFLQQKVAGIKALQGNVEEAETLYQEALYTFSKYQLCRECSKQLYGNMQNF